MSLTIIKPNPAAARGRMHGYHITVIAKDGSRSTYAVMALTGREAIDRLRALHDERTFTMVAA